ncbi:MAG TPA: hypothetical protein DCQ64_12560 [Candidatus Rokubacteria bacterium]|nr:hypothetical protein [Candidatus Rokubacteria bacterium]
MPRKRLDIAAFLSAQRQLIAGQQDLQRLGLSRAACLVGEALECMQHDAATVEKRGAKPKTETK